MTDQKFNQFLVENNKDKGMTNAQAVCLIWASIAMAICFASFLFLPTLMDVTK